MDASLGNLLGDEDNEWVMDFLVNSKFQWLVTTLNLCQPGRTDENKKRKPTAPQMEACTPNLVQTIKEFNPHIVVALGGDVLKWLWPKDRGEAPSITRARSTPVKAGGRWLVTSFDPELHGRWIRSNGREGQDLTEEYIRLFTQLHDILNGSFVQKAVEFTVIRTWQESIQVADFFDRVNVKTVYFDTEETTWLPFGNKPVRPHKEDPEGTEDERLTMHHPGATLLMVGLTGIYRDLDGSRMYSTYCFLPTAFYTDGGTKALMRIFSGRQLEAWNSLHDCQSIEIFQKLNLFPVCTGPGRNIPGCQVGDGMLKRALPDQSRTGNGLKPTAQDLLSAPDWALQLDQMKASVRTQRLKRKEPGMVHMGMFPIEEITCPYNANDTYQNARLVEEKLTEENLGKDFPWLVYNMLIEGYPWILEMQRNGVPAQQHLFEEHLDELEKKETKLLKLLRSVPEVIRAEAQSGKEFNIRSPIFYKALILEFLGVPNGAGENVIPDTFPVTECGRLGSDKDVIGDLAGEIFGSEVPWEDKTRIQRFFTRVMEWRKVGDDYSRIIGLFNYIVNDRIHTSFRMIASHTEMGDDTGAGEADGGARSGRSSTSPNLQNKTPRWNFLFQSKPGLVWVKGDYGRIELAWIAWNCKDPLMMQWAMEGRDQHVARGATLWSYNTGRDISEFEELTKAEKAPWRKLGKTQNFAIIYLQEPTTTSAINNIPLTDVMAGLAAADEMHPRIREAKMKLFEDCQAGRIIRTTFGRCRSQYLKTKRGELNWTKTSMNAEAWVSLDPDVSNRRNPDNLSIFRSLWNSQAAQSDASDTAYAMGSYIHKRIQGRNWLDPNKVKAMAWEHDCLGWEIPEDYVDEAVPELYKQMRDLSILPIKFGLPLPVDFKVGRIPFECEPEEYDKYPNTLRPYKVKE